MHRHHKEKDMTLALFTLFLMPPTIGYLYALKRGIHWQEEFAMAEKGQK